MTAVRERLMTALQAAAGAFNSGLDDNQAVIKAATDLQLNRDETQRLIEMFNTGKALNHYQKTAGDRTAMFTLANPDIVFANMLAPKQATTPNYEAPDYSFYEQAIKAEPCADDSIMWAGIPKSAGQRQLGDVIDSIHRKLDDQQKLVNSSASAKTACELHYNYAVTTVADIMQQRSADMPKLGRALAADYGDAGLKLAADVAYRLGMSPVAAPASRMLDTFLHDNPGLQSNCATAVDAANGYAEMNEVYKQAASELASSMDDFNGALASVFSTPTPVYSQQTFTDIDSMLSKSAARPAKPSDSSGDVLGQADTIRHHLFDVDKDNALTQLAGSAGGMAGKGFGSTIEESIAKALKPDSDDSKIFERMRNVQRQAMLESMLVRDPVLRSADPTLTAQAYASLIRVAPEVSLNQEVVRSVLRQAVQSSGISPYDMKNVADLENTIRKNMYMNAESKGK